MSVGARRSTTPAVRRGRASTRARVRRREGRALARDSGRRERGSATAAGSRARPRCPPAPLPLCSPLSPPPPPPLPPPPPPPPRCPAPLRARAHANDETGSCSWGALPRALHRLGSSPRIPFYRFASTTLVPVRPYPTPAPHHSPWLYVPPCPIPPLRHLPTIPHPPLGSRDRARAEILVVFLHLPSTLLSFPLGAGHPVAVSPSCVRWHAAGICVHARTHARTHSYSKRRVVRQRGPPDSSPAAWQTPNGPTATVDTLPNLLGPVRRGVLQGCWKQREAVKFGKWNYSARSGNTISTPRLSISSIASIVSVSAQYRIWSIERDADSSRVSLLYQVIDSISNRIN
jgi:hypothetical protein